MLKVKALIQHLLVKRGYAIKKLDRNFDTIIGEAVAKLRFAEQNLVVFDVGAHAGSSIERFKRLFGNGGGG